MPGLTVRPTAAALAGAVAHLGWFAGDFDHGRELAMPTGGTQLLVNLDADTLTSTDLSGLTLRTGGAAIQAATDAPAVIDLAQQRAIVWVAFRPGGAYPFAGGALTGGGLVDLADVWGGDGATLRERLLHAGDPPAILRELERVLLTRVGERDPAVTTAAAALDRGEPVAAVADSLGWTPRTLGRRFALRTGLAPKRFSRVRRFQRLLREVTGAEPDWARLAVECGYYDQSHLINDFRELSGLTPARYRPREPGERNHVPISPIPGGPGAAAWRT